MATTSSAHSHRKSLDEGFAAVQNELLRMGSLLDTALDQSIQALRNRDTALARRIVDGDQVFNRLRFEVEEACLALIATQQPAAGDLRVIMAMDSLAVELERMADHVEGIAKIVLRLGEEPLVRPLQEIPEMASIARRMLRQSLDSFVARDAEAARRVGAEDDSIDHLYRALFDEMVGLMAKDPTTVSRGTYILWCAHNLERIGDRITNIAERVIFMTTGDFHEINW
jgi:phosphate transport system protein